MAVSRRPAEAARGMTAAVEVQFGMTRRGLPDERFVQGAAVAALADTGRAAALTVRVVGLREARRLNRTFRGIDRATNVLSFPASGLDEIAPEYLGDIAICAPLVAREARDQGKPRRDHFAHLVVHGVLHLLGFDHQCDADAVVMEKREREVLSSLGIADPYRA